MSLAQWGDPAEGHVSAYGPPPETVLLLDCNKLTSASPTMQTGTASRAGRTGKIGQNAVSLYSEHAKHFRIETSSVVCLDHT